MINIYRVVESENEPRIRSGSRRGASGMRPLLEELRRTPGIAEIEGATATGINTSVDADGMEDANEATDVGAQTTTASVIVHHTGASVPHRESVGGEQYVRGEKEKYSVDEGDVEIVKTESYSEEQERSPSPSGKLKKLSTPQTTKDRH